MTVIKFLLFSLALLFFNGLFSQSNECGTVESPDPKFNIIQFQAFKKKLQKESLSKSTIYIPIKAHIVRTSAGSGGLSETQLLEAIDTLNGIYAPSGIVFFLCDGINFINSSLLFDYDANTESSEIFQYYENDALNIYFFNSVISTSGNSVCGFAHLPWGSNQLDDYVAMKNSCAVNGSTLSHEVGHFFGLYHTHHTSIGDEFVNGSNCSFAGDLCCDTPADPTLGTSNVSTSCVYTGTETDANGDAYNPDPTNLMSYARKSCRNYLSPDQYARVLYYQQLSRNYLTCVAVDDILVNNLTFDSTLYFAGGSIDLTIEQHYAGFWYSADLPTSHVGFYLSTDTLISSDDVLLSELPSSIGSDHPIDTLSVSISIPTNIETGDYYLIAHGDNEEVFTESDENNNINFLALSIENDLGEEIIIYPNPVADYLTYDTGKEVIESIEIINNIGQLIEVVSVFDGIIDMTHLSIGSYTVRFTNSEDQSTVFHVVKQ